MRYEGLNSGGKEFAAATEAAEEKEENEENGKQRLVRYKGLSSWRIKQQQQKKKSEKKKEGGE